MHVCVQKHRHVHTVPCTHQILKSLSTMAHTLITLYLNVSRACLTCCGAAQRWSQGTQSIQHTHFFKCTLIAIRQMRQWAQMYGVWLWWSCIKSEHLSVSVLLKIILHSAVGSLSDITLSRLSFLSYIYACALYAFMCVLHVKFKVNIFSVLRKPNRFPFQRKIVNSSPWLSQSINLLFIGGFLSSCSSLHMRGVGDGEKGGNVIRVTMRRSVWFNFFCFHHLSPFFFPLFDSYKESQLSSSICRPLTQFWMTAIDLQSLGVVWWHCHHHYGTYPSKLSWY